MKIGILWDLDGTLLDTLQDLADATNYALEKHGLPKRSLDEVRRFVGNGARRLIEQATGGVKVDEALHTFHTHYDAHCRIHTAPYEGIMEVLAVVGEKYPMAIVSNKPDSAVKALCGDLFSGIRARGESAGCPRKPAPDMVLRTMEELGVEGCVYVGDSEVDVLTAQNAGVPCLSVLWGFREEETLRSAGAKWFCRTPGELLERIEEIKETVYGK